MTQAEESDLVERLKERANWYPKTPHSYGPDPATKALFCEAAAEIARLRAENAWLQQEKKEARQALREIDAALDGGADQTSPTLFKAERARAAIEALVGAAEPFAKAYYDRRSVLGTEHGARVLFHTIGMDGPTIANLRALSRAVEDARGALGDMRQNVVAAQCPADGEPDAGK